jgi:hypothetical protein
LGQQGCWGSYFGDSGVFQQNEYSKNMHRIQKLN